MLLKIKQKNENTMKIKKKPEFKRERSMRFFTPQHRLGKLLESGVLGDWWGGGLGTDSPGCVTVSDEYSQGDADIGTIPQVCRLVDTINYDLGQAGG